MKRTKNKTKMIGADWGAPCVCDRFARLCFPPLPSPLFFPSALAPRCPNAVAALTSLRATRTLSLLPRPLQRQHTR